MKKLIQLKANQQKLRHQIQKEKRKKHKEFVKEHKPFLIFLDVLVIITILMNFGALVMTDYAVMAKNYIKAEEENITIVILEANKIQATINQFKTPGEHAKDLGYSEEQIKAEDDKSRELINRMVRQSLLWSVIIFFYVYFRRTIYTTSQLYTLTFIAFFYFCVLGYDFNHDLGLILAKLRYG